VYADKYCCSTAALLLNSPRLEEFANVNIFILSLVVLEYELWATEWPLFHIIASQATALLAAQVYKVCNNWVTTNNKLETA
jgi:hypothetical protein